MRTQWGETLLEMSRRAPVLVVFLRHAGWTFCRQALADIAARRQAISTAGAQIALVHMEPEADAKKLFANFHVDDLPRISDPTQELYRAFQLRRGGLSDVMGPGVWGAGFKSLLAGHLPGIPSADVMQLPGVFLLHNGSVLRSFRHATSGDRPDYVDLATCPVK